MEVNVKLPKYEVEVILDALKTAATLYGSARVTALTSGDAEEYRMYNEKKVMAWQAYDHIHHILERLIRETAI